MKKNVGYNKKPATIVWLENDFWPTWNGLIDCLTAFTENQLRELLTQLKDQNYQDGFASKLLHSLHNTNEVAFSTRSLMVASPFMIPKARAVQATRGLTNKRR